MLSSVKQCWKEDTRVVSCFTVSHHRFPREIASQKRAQKFDTDDASLTRSWQFCEAKASHGTTNQKHQPDLGIDASSGGISAVVSQTSFCGEIGGGVAECWVFSQAIFMLISGEHSRN